VLRGQTRGPQKKTFRHQAAREMERGRKNEPVRRNQVNILGGGSNQRKKIKLSSFWIPYGAKERQREPKGYKEWGEKKKSLCEARRSALKPQCQDIAGLARGSPVEGDHVGRGEHYPKGGFQKEVSASGETTPK